MSLASEIAQDIEDAKRYRFLRDKATPELCRIYIATDRPTQVMRADAIDAAIDMDMEDAQSPSD